MSAAMLIAILVSGFGGSAAVLYFIWPDVVATTKNEG